MSRKTHLIVYREPSFIRTDSNRLNYADNYILNFTHPYDLLIVPFENSLPGPGNEGK